jgi:hypothetical protein
MDLCRYYNIPSLEIAFQNINMVYHCAVFSFDPKEEERWRKQILKAQYCKLLLA